MTFKPKYVAAVSFIIIIVVIASTAGCTSSSTSSNQQASQVASSGQAASGYPPDTTGSDPNPSVVPRYNPSQRSIYEQVSKYATSYEYLTKDTISQVSSFYKTQMKNLGYTVNETGSFGGTGGYSLTSYEKNDGKTLVSVQIYPGTDTKLNGKLPGNYTVIDATVVEL